LTRKLRTLFAEVFIARRPQPDSQSRQSWLSSQLRKRKHFCVSSADTLTKNCVQKLQRELRELCCRNTASSGLSFSLALGLVVARASAIVRVAQARQDADDVLLFLAAGRARGGAVALRQGV